VSLANVMLSVRAKRERVDTILEHLGLMLDLNEHSKDRLFSNFWIRRDCRSKLAALESAIVELNDAEKEALKIKQDEDQMKSVFDDGKLCP
jgi:hypothetical protein